MGIDLLLKSLSKHIVIPIVEKLFNYIVFGDNLLFSVEAKQALQEYEAFGLKFNFKNSFKIPIVPSGNEKKKMKVFKTSLSDRLRL